MTLKNSPFGKKLKNADALKSSKEEKKFILDERGPDLVKDQAPLFELPVTDELPEDNESVTDTQEEYNSKMLIEMLPGLEKRILLFVLSNANDLNRNGILIKNKDLLEASKTAPASLRNAISRLKTKNIVEIVKTQNGPGGWRLLKVNDRYIGNKQ